MSSQKAGPSVRFFVVLAAVACGVLWAVPQSAPVHAQDREDKPTVRSSPDTSATQNALRVRPYPEAVRERISQVRSRYPHLAPPLASMEKKKAAPSSTPNNTAPVFWDVYVYEVADADGDGNYERWTHLVDVDHPSCDGTVSTSITITDDNGENYGTFGPFEFTDCSGADNVVIDEIFSPTLANVAAPSTVVFTFTLDNGGATETLDVPVDDPGSFAPFDAGVAPINPIDTNGDDELEGWDLLLSGDDGNCDGGFLVTRAGLTDSEDNDYGILSPFYFFDCDVTDYVYGTFTSNLVGPSDPPEDVTFFFTLLLTGDAADGVVTVDEPAADVPAFFSVFVNDSVDRDADGFLEQWNFSADVDDVADCSGDITTSIAVSDEKGNDYGEFGPFTFEDCLGSDNALLSPFSAKTASLSEPEYLTFTFQLTVGGHVYTLVIPVDDAASVVTPELAHSPGELSFSTAGSHEGELSISNTGDGSLTWSIQRFLFGVSPDGGAAGSVQGTRSGSRLQSLLETADDEKAVRVIVGIEAAFQPEGYLSSADVGRQRRRIASNREQVLADVGIGRDRVRGTFDTIPYVVLEVDGPSLRRLAAHPRVTSIEEDRAVPPTLLESTEIIGADVARDRGFTGAGWAVAILDTGVDGAHPFLAGKVVDEACFSTTIPGERTSLCPNREDEQIGAGAGANCDANLDACDHGTHVAGIAAGKGEAFSGVAPDGDVIAVQVFSEEEDDVTALFSDVTKALEYVYSIRETHDIAAANLSLGGGFYEEYCDATRPAVTSAIENLRSVGIASVISSGNDGFADGIGAPACISAAVSVGATQDGSAGTTVDRVASFSNSADILDLLAPGRAIDSSVPGGGFETFSGTSMSAPHVAGAWAVLRQNDPEATVDDVLGALTLTGVPVHDDRNRLVKPRIQLDAALGATPWLTVTPAAGSVAGSETQAVTVSVDGTGLDPGTYGATMVIASNDFDDPVVEVPVEFAVAEPIPVEFTGLDVALNGSSAVLTWATAQESNNAGFEVQRRVHSTSADRASRETSWRPLRFVNGKGTTDTPQTYRFVDRHVPFTAGVVYYRLKQVDVDGTATLTEEVRVDRGHPASVVLHRPYPNPVTDRFTVRYELPSAGPVRLEVFNLLGQRVGLVVNDHESAGRKERLVDIEHLGSGIHFVRLRAGQTIRTARIAVVR